MESTVQNTVTKEVLVQDNNNNLENNPTTKSMANTTFRQTFSQTDTTLKNTTSTITPKVFKCPSWNNMVAEDMNIDDEEDKASVSSEFLRDIAAENAATAENSNNQKGKLKNPDEPINDDSFIKYSKLLNLSHSSF